MFQLLFFFFFLITITGFKNIQYKFKNIQGYSNEIIKFKNIQDFRLTVWTLIVSCKKHIAISSACSEIMGWELWATDQRFTDDGSGGWPCEHFYLARGVNQHVPAKSHHDTAALFRCFLTKTDIQLLTKYFKGQCKANGSRPVFSKLNVITYLCSRPLFSKKSITYNREKDRNVYCIHMLLARGIIRKLIHKSTKLIN